MTWSPNFLHNRISAVADLQCWSLYCTVLSVLISKLAELHNLWSWFSISEYFSTGFHFTRWLILWFALNMIIEFRRLIWTLFLIFYSSLSIEKSSHTLFIFMKCDYILSQSNYVKVTWTFVSNLKPFMVIFFISATSNAAVAHFFLLRFCCPWRQNSFIQSLLLTGM